MRVGFVRTRTGTRVVACSSVAFLLAVRAVPSERVPLRRPQELTTRPDVALGGVFYGELEHLRGVVPRSGDSQLGFKGIVRTARRVPAGRHPRVERNRRPSVQIGARICTHIKRRTRGVASQVRFNSRSASADGHAFPSKIVKPVFAVVVLARPRRVRHFQSLTDAVFPVVAISN